jgi:vacuole morphology and inheritance protein 14
VTVSFLIEIDKLVQLLESPIFICTSPLLRMGSSQIKSVIGTDVVLLPPADTDLRLQLLEPEKYPYLFKSLYGLLMLLPQSSAFETLKNRLNSVTSLGVLQLIPKSKDKVPIPPNIDFPVLLEHFEKVQKKHAEHVRRVRMENERFGTPSGVTASGSASAPDSATATPRAFKLTASSANLIRDGSSNSLPK